MSLPDSTESGRSRRRLLAPGVLIAILALSFFLRAYRPLSRSPLWVERALDFKLAMLEGDWPATYKSRHPGFTTMAIGAVTYILYERAQGTPTEALFTWGASPYATVFGTQVAVGMMGLAAALTAGLLAIALALRRLSGWPFAVAAVGLISLSPFFLAQSRVFHVDALLSSLMTLSAILILIFAENRRYPALVASGLAGGYAILTKTPAVFLIPYSGLVLLTYLIRDVVVHWSEHAADRLQWLVAEFGRKLVAPLLVWLLALLPPFASWPLMWIKPVATLGNMYAGAMEHVENAHPNPRLFAGQIYESQPPPVTYYPSSLVFHTTFVTLALIVVSLLAYTVWRKRVQLPVPPITYWLMAAYVGFFTIQMMISAKQIDRYALPAQVFMEMLAAAGLIGLVSLFRNASAKSPPGRRRRLMPLTIGAALGLHALVTLPFFPDFGAHNNYLLGNNQVAVHLFELSGQDEGVTQIVRYIRELPDGDRVNVRTRSQRQSLSQYIPVLNATDPPDPALPEYFVFSFHETERGRLSGDLLAYWEEFQDDAPVMTVSFDGITYMWLFASPPDPDQETIMIRIGGGWAFTALAWIATIGLAAALIRVVRSRPDG